MKEKKETCKKCNGHGGEFSGDGSPFKECRNCDGTGEVHPCCPEPLINKICPKCQGAGGMQWKTSSTDTTWEFCDECKGTGWIGEIGQIVGALQNATGTTPPKSTIYKRALNLWGNAAQINMAIEELSELIVKLAKSDRRNNGATIDEVAEEIADVEIMMAQLRILFGDEIVEKAKQKKLARLEERVKYGEGHN